MNRRPSPTLRSAFTLVELLVVITIIAILVSLLLPAVQKIRVYGKRAQTGADITQLSTAAASFKQEFKFYPPESFTIPANKNASDPNNQIVAQMFRPYASSLDQGNTGTVPSGMAGAGTTLRGIQCLIYFCGGPQGTGWAIDAPIAPTGTANAKKGPFYDVPAAALANGYMHVDAFGLPYVYFASSTGQKYGIGGLYTGTSPLGSPNNVTPYTSGGKFVNPDSVQIISAGANKMYGRGGVWSPGNNDYAGGGTGEDDVANFNGGDQLGAQ